MSDIDITTIAVSLPTEKLRRLERYAARSNSPLGNALSRAITAGLDAINEQHPGIAQ